MFIMIFHKYTINYIALSYIILVYTTYTLYKSATQYL